MFQKHAIVQLAELLQKHLAPQGQREETGAGRSMGKKELRVVVSFATTTQAMAMEETAKAAGLKGRLIPIPRQITADCGLAWSEPAQNRVALELLMQEKKLQCDQVVELVI